MLTKTGPNFQPKSVADELAEMGFNLPMEEGEFSPPTTNFIEKEVNRVEDRRKELLSYREIQGLHLTEIQAKILQAISDYKIQEASLKDLVTAFKTLKEKELVMDGKPSEIKGLVSFLIELEEEEKAAKEQTIDITPEKEPTEQENLPVNVQ
jgi:hypothetical protein